VGPSGLGFFFFFFFNARVFLNVYEVNVMDVYNRIRDLALCT